ncbi:MAG: GGDEF domain-containing protein [Sulfurimonadaceae bacterium]
MKYIYPLFVLVFSIVFLLVEGSFVQVNAEINYFGLAVYGSISAIMMLSLFIVQKIIDIKEVYYYLLAGFSFIYISLFTGTVESVYAYPVTSINVLEDLFRLVGFGFVIAAIIKWIKHDEEIKIKLLELASIDDLTGIMNRRVFDIEFKRDFANAKRYNKALSLVTIDLDNFKAINDKHGHFFGDLVLKMFAKEVTALLREGDIFSRWGGDEFCIILPETSGVNAMRVAEKIRFAVKNIHVKTDKNPIYFTVSLGVTEFHREDKDAMIMIDRADKALYEAKEAGRDKTVPR